MSGCADAIVRGRIPFGLVKDGLTHNGVSMVNRVDSRGGTHMRAPGCVSAALQLYEWIALLAIAAVSV